MKKNFTLSARLCWFVILSSIVGMTYATNDLSSTRNIVRQPTAEYLQVNAGDDATICAGDEYQLNGTASNYNEIFWSTGGDGFFDNPDILNPVYTPGPADVESGTVELCLNAIGDESQVTDCMTLFITGLPWVNAGNDVTACEDIIYSNTPFVDLCATGENYASLHWIIEDGMGFFDPEFDLCTSYYVSQGDIFFGEVSLCVLAFPLNPCQLYAEDCITLSFDPEPVVYAGENLTICETESLDFAQSGIMPFIGNASTWNWITEGDGTFNDPNLILPVYTPGPGDISNGGVALGLVALPVGACTESVVDYMYLDITPVPTISIDSVIKLGCVNYDIEDACWYPVGLYADIANAASVQWMTSGDGYFSNPNQSNTQYHLGLNDMWANQITLTVTASGQGACQVSETREIALWVPGQLIQHDAPPTWKGISSYLDMSGKTVAEVFEPITGAETGENLPVMVKNIYGEYYYSGDTLPNFLGNWEPFGYKMKIQDDCCLPLYGEALSDRTIEVGDGMNWIPVLTNVPVSIDDFFGPDLYSKFAFIIDYTTGDIRPSMGPVGAGMLTDLEPGTMYLLITLPNTAPYTLTYPEIDPEHTIYNSFVLNKNANPGVSSKALVKSGKTNNEKMHRALNVYQSHWNPIGPRESSAVYQINSPEIQGIDVVPGQDSIGLFTPRGKCAGTSAFTPTISPFLTENEGHLLFYGLPGFEYSDPVELRYYQPGSNREFILNYQFRDFFTPNQVISNVAHFNYDGFGEFSGLSYQKEVQRVPVPKGWSGISSFLIPEISNLDSVLFPVDSALVMLNNFDGIYWPAQNVNTLGTWNSHSGYAVKVTDSIELQIQGNLDDNRTLVVPAGWSMIPVLSTCPVPVADIFGQTGTQLLLIKEIAGYRVFWPEWNISSLQYLKPGRAYLVLMNNSVSITLPECTNTSGAANPGAKSFVIPGWNVIAKTSLSHTIGIVPDEIFENSGLRTGDVVGAFDGEGNCCGMQEITAENVTLTIFGDDPATPQKDGFRDGEDILFRLYRSQTFEEFTLDVSLSMDYPDHQNKFVTNGLSVIRSAKTGVLGISNVALNCILNLRPNPAVDALHISYVQWIEGNRVIIISDASGRNLIEKCIRSTKGMHDETLDISTLPVNTYLLRMVDEEGRLLGKGLFIKR